MASGSSQAMAEQVWEIVNRNYVDDSFNGTDWSDRRQSLLASDYTSEEQAYAAIRDALSSLDDPYTRLIDPSQFSQLQEMASLGEQFGAGLTIGFDREGYLSVTAPPPLESPAFAAGLRAGDRIVALNGTSSTDLNFSTISQQLHQNGSVALIVQRHNTGTIEIELPTGDLQMSSVNYAVQSLGNRPIGYIRLLKFDRSAAEEVRSALIFLESRGVEGYVLDLRGNPGGLLSASVEIAQMFLEDGPIVTLKRRSGTQVLESTDNVVTDNPLVVLVDGGSASSSEVLAGALQDRERAILVGTRTFGKGVVQSVEVLQNQAFLSVTVARYLTPDGRDIHQQGITPDLLAELSTADLSRLAGDRQRVATLKDPQYAAALQALQQQIDG
jgi:carboxyl-terminal processing protease